MTDELIKRLMSVGLTKQQATSMTAETLVQLFMPDDGKALIREAQMQVYEMRKMVAQLKADYSATKEKINGISDVLLAVTEAQEQYGALTDEKAKNVVALYAALVGMGERAGASAADAVNSASYIIYAYLGGQAKREISYTPADPS